MHKRLVLLALATAPGIWVAAPRTTKNGVKPTEVLIGQCTALTGPAAGLGTGVQLGLRAALEEANEKGGISGRKVTLKSLDAAVMAAEPDAVVTREYQAALKKTAPTEAPS